MPVENGSQAPRFTLNDAAEGAPHSLDDALGRGPVVIGIYKSSCQASKTAFPFLEKLYQGYPKDRLTVLGVSQDSANVTRSFARRAGVTFPILVEEEGYGVSREFDIIATPSVFLIARDGTVLWQSVGFQKAEMEALSQRIAELLDVPPVDVLAGAEGQPAWVPG